MPWVHYEFGNISKLAKMGTIFHLFFFYLSTLFYINFFVCFFGHQVVPFTKYAIIVLHKVIM